MKMINANLVRVYTQGISIMDQGAVILEVFKGLQGHWEYLKTVDGKCIITEQVATGAKRILVKKYMVEAIKEIRGIIGLDLATSTIDNVESLWRVDYMIGVYADNKIESHEHLFKEILASIFGISGRILNFIFNGNSSKNELYGILRDLYNVNVVIDEDDKQIDSKWLTERLNEYLVSGTSSEIKYQEILS